jgi:hypothetical protein
MAPTDRIIAGESVLVGVEGGALKSLHSAVTPNSKPEFAASRPFGAMNDTTVTLMKEHGEAAIAGTNLILEELALFLRASLGDVTTETIGALTRHTAVVRTFETPALEPLVIYRGTDRRAERMSGAYVQSLSWSISKNGSTSALSGSIVGDGLEVGISFPSAAAQELTVVGNATEGTFTLTVAGKTTGNIPFDAEAEQVQAALEAKLGKGKVAVAGEALPANPLLLTFIGSEIVGLGTATSSFGAEDDGDATLTLISDGAEAPAIGDSAVQPGQTAIYVGKERPTTDARNINEESGHVIQAFDYALADTVIENHALDGGGPSPKAWLPNSARTLEVKTWLEGSDVGMSIVTDYRKDEVFYISQVSLLPNGKSLVVHTKGKVFGLDDLGDDSGRLGFSVTWKPVHEPVWGGSSIIEVTC